MQTDPIFIIGTERSGSNLLRLMLNAHSAVAVPHPPHILNYFSPLLKYYGDLAEPRRMKRLIKDVLALLDTHIYPWEIRIDPGIFQTDPPPVDLFGIFSRIYDEYLRGTGKRRWGNKSTFMIHHAGTVLDAYPNAKFLWLVRDPRAVAASSKKSVFSPFHPYYTARLWRTQQIEGLKLLDSLSEKNIILVRYEDLVTDPESSLAGICAFIDEEYEPGMLEFHRTGSARKSAGLSASWVNSASPVQTGRLSAYRKDLTRRQGRVVELVAAGLMDRFEYEREYSGEAGAGRRKEDRPACTPTLPEMCMYRLVHTALFLEVEFKSMLYDKNHWLRWGRNLLLLRLFLARRFGKPAAAGGAG